jgi:hypothetical protein
VGKLSPLKTVCLFLERIKKARTQRWVSSKKSFLQPKERLDKNVSFFLQILFSSKATFGQERSFESFFLVFFHRKKVNIVYGHFFLHHVRCVNKKFPNVSF